MTATSTMPHRSRLRKAASVVGLIVAAAGGGVVVGYWPGRRASVAVTDRASEFIRTRDRVFQALQKAEELPSGLVLRRPVFPSTHDRSQPGSDFLQVSLVDEGADWHRLAAQQIELTFDPSLPPPQSGYEEAQLAETLIFQHEAELLEAGLVGYEDFLGPRLLDYGSRTGVWHTADDSLVVIVCAEVRSQAGSSSLIRIVLQSHDGWAPKHVDAASHGDSNTSH